MHKEPLKVALYVHNRMFLRVFRVSGQYEIILCDRNLVYFIDISNASDQREGSRTDLIAVSYACGDTPYSLTNAL